MKLSEVSAVLREIGVSPVRSLGQNFLHDRNLARWIVDQANLTADDYVIEIGPGLGALTQFALAKGAHVLAIDTCSRSKKTSDSFSICATNFELMRSRLFTVTRSNSTRESCTRNDK